MGFPSTYWGALTCPIASTADWIALVRPDPTTSAATVGWVVPEYVGIAYPTSVVMMVATQWIWVEARPVATIWSDP